MTQAWSDLFAARTRRAGGGLAAILALGNATDVISFSGGFPDPSTFPNDVLVDITRRVLETRDSTPLQYAPTAGLPGPLDFVAGRLERLEGVRPREGELMLTSGGIEGLELVAKSFLDAGDAVVVEAPTYLGALMAFAGYAVEVAPVPLDDEGLEVDALAAALGAGLRPKLLYTIPDFQNPAGVTLTLERRLALLELARRHRFLIVEDVAYRELGFRDDRPPGLWSLAPDVVVQLGTFSKTFCPGVRLGWAAGPADVVAQLVVAKQNTDQCASALGQRLVEEYGRSGLMDEQIVRSRELYGRRCALMLEALAVSMPEDVAWTRPSGGFFTWLTFPDGTDSAALAAEAMRAGVAFVAGAPFFPDGRGALHARLSFSRVVDDDIPRGVERLAAALEGAAARA